MKRAVKLFVEPFDFISYLDWKCVCKFNEHGTLRVRGLISHENMQVYYQEVVKIQETWICAKALTETDEEIDLFRGVLTGLDFQTENELCTLTIEAKTGSYLLDQAHHMRSYQSDTLTYSDVLTACLESENGKFIMFDRQDELVDGLLIQYKETDWTFSKRLAANLGTVIWPDSYTDGRHFYIGLNQKKNESMQEITTDSFRLHESAVDTTINENRWKESFSWQIQSRDIYKLGEFVQFQGQRLVVGEVESSLVGSEISHQYSLYRPKADVAIQRFFNNAIKGVSLRSTVVYVKRDQVQVQIHEDENKELCGVRWFDYATVYSTPDGTGWYCMPEIGDEVRLLFPNVDERNAYVVSSVHLDAERGRENPDEKSWKNKQQKEILFTPDRLLLRNNDGLLVELSDAEGVRIISNKAITIQSDDNIEITSENAHVQMYADNHIALQQQSTSIHMKDEIRIGGGKIYMN